MTATAIERRPMALVGKNHPALRAVAAHIEDPLSEEMLVLANRMALTLDRTRNPRGVALAAPQVGARVRLIVLSKTEVFANPILTRHAGSVRAAETCLSLPGRRYSVVRAESVRVHAFDVVAEEQTTVDVTGFTARVWQHEVDHLDGVLVSEQWPEIRGGGSR